MPNPIITRLRMAASILLKGPVPALPARMEIPALTADEIAEVKAFFPMEKFFIFGHARSGTTLLARLIRLHPDVHCNWQAHFFTRAPLLKSLVSDPDVARWLARRSNRWNGGRDLSPLVLRATADFIMEREARRLGKKIVGDKSPSSVLHGGSVHNMYAVYPDGTLIYIVRDGRDTVLSHRIQAFVDQTGRLDRTDQRIRDDFIRDPQPFLNGERSLFTEKELRAVAQGWVRNVTETEQEGRSLYGGRYLHIRYEDLLASPWDTMRRVWGLLGVKRLNTALEQALRTEMESNPDADWQQEKSDEVAQNVQKGRQGNWQTIFTPRDRTLFKEIAGEVLFKWGYEEERA